MPGRGNSLPGIFLFPSWSSCPKRKYTACRPCEKQVKPQFSRGFPLFIFYSNEIGDINGWAGPLYRS